MTAGELSELTLGLTAEERGFVLGEYRSVEKSHIRAALLTFLFGGLGAHRLYIGEYRAALRYLLFSWTLVPFALAWFDWRRVRRRVTQFNEAEARGFHEFILRLRPHQRALRGDPMRIVNEDLGFGRYECVKIAGLDSRDERKVYVLLYKDGTYPMGWPERVPWVTRGTDFVTGRGAELDGPAVQVGPEGADWYLTVPESTWGEVMEWIEQEATAP